MLLRTHNPWNPIGFESTKLVGRDLHTISHKSMITHKPYFLAGKTHRFQGLNWCWWVCTHSIHMDPHFCIFWHLCISEIFSTIQIPSTPLHSQTPKCPAHMSTISECFTMCPHIMHQHISKYLTSSTHVLHVARTFAHTQTHIPSYPIKFQVHYITYPNIFLHKSTHMPNTQYYPCTACRIFATPSETFGHNFIRLYSIPNTLIHISEYFYCTRTCIHAFSSLHSSPSIRHLLSILWNLALTSDQLSSTAIPHLHSPK